jgi:hypothetical protein
LANEKLNGTIETAAAAAVVPKNLRLEIIDFFIYSIALEFQIIFNPMNLQLNPGITRERPDDFSVDWKYSPGNREKIIKPSGNNRLFLPFINHSRTKLPLLLFPVTMTGLILPADETIFTFSTNLADLLLQ